MAYYNYSPRYGLENYSFIFPFENTFDSFKSTAWMQENWHHSITMSIFYIIAIYLGRKLVEARNPYGLDFPLFLWNFGLVIFLIVGVVRMTPEMFWSVNSNSFIYSVCTASFAQGVTTSYWAKLFGILKFEQCVDTVLRKRSLRIPHWYYHITVLVYTWHAYKDHTASGRWFIWMNYAVHAFMYSYYAIRALKIRVPKSCAMIVTLLQLVQMAVGLYIGIIIYNLKSAGKSCQQTWSNLYFLFTLHYFYINFFFVLNFWKWINYFKVAEPVKGAEKILNRIHRHSNEIKNVTNNFQSSNYFFGDSSALIKKFQSGLDRNWDENDESGEIDENIEVSEHEFLKAMLRHRRQGNRNKQ